MIENIETDLRFHCAIRERNRDIHLVHEFQTTKTKQRIAEKKNEHGIYVVSNKIS